MIYCLLCTEALMRDDPYDLTGVAHVPIPEAPLPVFIQYAESIRATDCGVLCATCAGTGLGNARTFQALRRAIVEDR